MSKKRSPKLKLRRIAGVEKVEEKNLLEGKETPFYDDYNDVGVECVNSWLLSIFVKVFD